MKEQKRNCASGFTKCRDGIHCFPYSSLCDGQEVYCADGSDEDDEFCKETINQDTIKLKTRFYEYLRSLSLKGHEKRIMKVYQVANMTLKFVYYAFLVFVNSCILKSSVDAAAQTCPSTHAKCRDGIQCFPLQDLCDGDNTYCLDQSDEDPDFCREQSCPEFDGWGGWNGWRKCRDGKQCFNAKGLCDDDPAYCNDESDQDPDFCKIHECGNDYVKCRDGIQCIHRNRLCDGYRWSPKIDCVDQKENDRVPHEVTRLRAQRWLYRQLDFCSDF
ncbi:LRP2 [Mytilus edulis]|uniref:LRP2 n=1 Tax=Mytilus edulis TaxID=6550 RepID=A0A8S3V9M0_MYTED|nr:LRP2 [Mytilus edulis]